MNSFIRACLTSGVASDMTGPPVGCGQLIPAMGGRRWAKREALLAAVVADPDADLPRLRCTLTGCDDRGTATLAVRAEFIRLWQCGRRPVCRTTDSELGRSWRHPSCQNRWADHSVRESWLGQIGHKWAGGLVGGGWYDGLAVTARPSTAGFPTQLIRPVRGRTGRRRRPCCSNADPGSAN